MSEFLTELDVLKDVSRRLDAAHIPFMLTGSLAMSFYALPRMTRDIDLVVELPKVAPASRNDSSLPTTFRKKWIANAIRHSTLFNLIHQASGDQGGLHRQEAQPLPHRGVSTPPAGAGLRIRNPGSPPNCADLILSVKLAQVRRVQLGAATRRPQKPPSHWL